MSRVLVLAGPSAVGKTTVMNEILSLSDRFEFMRSATTRAPRGDGHDSEYVYLSKQEFQSQIESGEMLEYTEYGGNFYGTPKSEIERAEALRKTPLLILDINGVANIKEKGIPVFAVYITVDNTVLDERLKERAISAGMTEKAIETMKRRMSANRRDAERKKEIEELFDLTVENVTPTDTANTIMQKYGK